MIYLKIVFAMLTNRSTKKAIVEGRVAGWKASEFVWFLNMMNIEKDINREKHSPKGISVRA